MKNKCNKEEKAIQEAFNKLWKESKGFWRKLSLLLFFPSAVNLYKAFKKALEKD